MKLFKFLAPVTIAAALVLTACAPAAPHAADAPYPTYTPATVSTPAAPAPVKVAAVKAPKVKAPAAVKAPAPKVAKVATPPAAPMDTITAPVPVAAPVIPAAYVPCSAVGMVADAHGVCHKPVKAPAPRPVAHKPVKVTPVPVPTLVTPVYPMGCTSIPCTMYNVMYYRPSAANTQDYPDYAALVDSNKPYGRDVLIAVPAPGHIFEGVAQIAYVVSLPTK